MTPGAGGAAGSARARGAGPCDRASSAGAAEARRRSAGGRAPPEPCGLEPAPGPDDADAPAVPRARRRRRRAALKVGQRTARKPRDPRTERPQPARAREAAPGLPAARADAVGCSARSAPPGRRRTFSPAVSRPRALHGRCPSVCPAARTCLCVPLWDPGASPTSPHPGSRRAFGAVPTSLELAGPQFAHPGHGVWVATRKVGGRDPDLLTHP